MKILITGSSGFIGQHLVEALLQAGYDVWGMDLVVSADERHRSRFFQCDLLVKSQVRDVLGEIKPDAVVHLAARTDLKGKDLDAYSVNTLGTRNLIEAMAETGNVQLCIFTSTQLVHPLGHPAVGDDEYHSPTTCYGASKAAMESLIREKDGGARTWCIVRPTTVWGPGMGGSYALFFRMIQRGLYFHVGYEPVRKSYGYIGNIVHQYRRLIEAPAALIDERVIYLADYEPILLQNWVDAMQRALGARRVRHFPKTFARLGARVGDVIQHLGFRNFPFNSFRLNNILKEYVYDLTATREVCGDIPYTLEQGADETARWAKSLSSGAERSKSITSGMRARPVCPDDGNRIKVLCVVPSLSPERGGPAKSSIELAAALTQLGVECEIVTTVGLRVGNQPQFVFGVPVHFFDTSPLGHVWTAFSPAAGRFLAREMGRFDLVHIHEVWHHLAYVAPHLARKHGIPYVVSVRGELDSWRFRYKTIRKMLYLRSILRPKLRNAAAVHTLNPQETQAVEDCGIDTPAFVAPNGVASHLPASSADRSEFLERYPQLVNKQVILFLSRLHAIKGLDVLAHSFTTVAAQFPDAVLLVAGPDEDESGRRVRSVLEQVGLRDRVVFTGLLTGAAKQAALDCADLFVLSSYSEGFSNAVLEAMAAGLPVVISEQCNFPEVIEHDAGYIVPVRAAPVAEAIGKLLADEKRRVRMGLNGRELVTKQYTWQAVAESFSDLYGTLLKGEQIPSPNTSG